MNRYIATCKFGLESVVAGELRALGAEEIKVEDARVFFSGSYEILCRANLWLRTADRVFLLVGQFPAKTFDELFEGVKALPWENILSKDSAFPVKGKTAKSALHSVSDCQKLTKKAIVERLKSKYHISWFPETGNQVIVEVGLLNDVATIALDASGAGLSRRGYRTLNAEAPLAETLAAALVLLSRYNGETPLRDPMCGSGTIPIEAALIAQNRAPGLKRRFAAEAWKEIPGHLWQQERTRALELEKRGVKFDIAGSDIDAEAVRIAKIHAKQAGVNVPFTQAPMRTLTHTEPHGTLITNPPYGERLEDRRACEKLYAELGRTFAALPDWKALIITAHPYFERSFGKRADKRRKLYNSGLLCQLYQYFYPKAERSDRFDRTEK